MPPKASEGVPEGSVQDVRDRRDSSLFAGKENIPYRHINQLLIKILRIIKSAALPAAPLCSLYFPSCALIFASIAEINSPISIWLRSLIIETVALGIIMRASGV